MYDVKTIQFCTTILVDKFLTNLPSGVSKKYNTQLGSGVVVSRSLVLTRNTYSK